MFTALSDLMGTSAPTVASGVSADGSVIVGHFETTTGRMAFRWTRDEGMVALGDLPGGAVSSSASDVSADGSVVVGISTSSSGHQAFRWTEEGDMVGLGYLSGGWTENSSASAVSADGQVVVGGSYSSSGTEGFRWTAEDGMVGLGDLPTGNFISRPYDTSSDGSVVVGFGTVAPTNSKEAFRWTESEGMVSIGRIPGGVGYPLTAAASAITDDGSVIVGGSSSPLTPYGEAFRWTSIEGMVGLGLLPDTIGGFAYDVSADGSVVVGDSYISIYSSKAFIWDPTHGIRDLKVVLESNYGLDLTGWDRLIEADKISADGRTIIGTGIHNGQVEGWVAHLTPVPEPSTLSLAIVALIVGEFVRRRRK